MKTFIIAELGINHNGDVVNCGKMISAAKDAGADAVKLQINNPRNISADPWLIGVQEKTRLSLGDLRAIGDYAAGVGIELFSSIGDVDAVDLFVKLEFPRVKISSSNALNLPLHERVTSLGIPVFLSIGDADIESIRRVVAFYKDNEISLTLLHCIPKYPTPRNACTLSAISYLRTELDLPIGFSDHTIGSDIAPRAVLAGATTIEKHFTLDKRQEGPDHSFSADPCEFRLMVEGIREAEALMGDARDLYDQSRDHSGSLVRRAIVFRQHRDAGHVITAEDILVARPKTQNPAAINPLNYHDVVGSVLCKPIQPFEALTEDHIACE